MDPTVDFKSFQEQVTSSLVNATRTASHISNDDLGFHRSSSAQVSQAIDNQNKRLLDLTNKLLKAATKDSSLLTPKLQNHDGVDDNWRCVVDVIDDLLEKADASLDEFSGVLRRLSPSLQDGRAGTPPRQVKDAKKVAMFYHPTTLRKPQLDFYKPVDNYDNTPFKPLLRSKPHALVALEEAIAPGQDGKYKHPYASEVEQLQYSPTVYVDSTPLLFTPPSDSKPVFVDTVEGVEAMLAELKLAKEIAVDLEHHDTHSFIGLVSLMQISTREKDWIVDTLKPWREELQILNKVFTDPKILKVFHGSTMDMIWLQRDLGLYVVGLFDTYHAAVSLEFPKRSLSYLLERFANFQAQKKYQLADWRVRPLPDELIDYARSDTHYLLYIYDNLRNMLLEASTPNDNLIDRVLAGSKKEALQIYDRPIYDAENGLGPVGWYKPLMQRTVRFDPQQFAVYRALHEWRDEKARSLDEGEPTIMTNASLWTLAEQMPNIVLDVHKVLRPVPPFVSKNAKEMIEVIKKAKRDGLNGPSIGEVMKRNEDKFGVTSTYKQKPQRNTEQLTRGVAATLQMLAIDKQGDGSVLSPVALKENLSASRSNSSLLWGGILPEVIASLGTSANAAAAALQSVLPLTALDIASVSTSSPIIPPPNAGQAAGPANQSAPNGVASSISNPVAVTTLEAEQFTIRDIIHSSKKRKIEAEHELLISDLPTLPEESGKYSDSAVLNGTLPVQPANVLLEERLLQKRKQDKRTKKAAKAAEAEATRVQMQQMQPFDYKNAESILYAKADGGNVNGGPLGSGVKAMNPFAKAMDTTTGAKRLKQGKEQAGKSMTFKK